MTSSSSKWMVFAALVAVLAGCGDDDGMMMAVDGGPMDTGTITVDTGPRDTGRRDSGPRDAGPPRFIECDPWAPGTCPEGRKCSVVLEQFPDDPMMNYVIFACVER